MRRVSVAASSRLAATAGAEIADRGGNAVDVAVAAAMVSLTTEPGIVALGGGGYVTVWPAGGEPVVVDGYVEMPGRGLAAERFGRGGREVFMEYGGGLHTIVGHGSVATPGAVAGLGAASARFGELPWHDLLAPAIRIAAQGFPLPPASDEYLAYSGESVYGWHPESRAAISDRDGRRLGAGETVRIAGLAGSLQLLADEGASVMYTGALAERIAADMAANEGLVTAADLAGYRAIARAPIVVELDDWTVALNPAPAVGGAGVAAILLLLEAERFSGWGPAEVRRMVEVQRAVFGYRKEHLEDGTHAERAVGRLLEAARLGDHRALLASPSTIHCSTVDSDGTACAITISAGYGSGVMVPGTGLWMNNSLGELELNPRGFHALAPGTRLVSNMAPTVARRRDGAVLAIGSPGADRITSAISQVLVNFMHLGLSLHDAIDHPRLHVEVFAGAPAIAAEPGVDLEAIDGYRVRRFPDRSMYFGGVQAAMWMPGAGHFEAADPRRTGGTARGGGAGAQTGGQGTA